MNQTRMPFGHRSAEFKWPSLHLESAEAAAAAAARLTCQSVVRGCVEMFNQVARQVLIITRATADTALTFAALASRFSL